MIFKSEFRDIRIPETGIYQFVTSNPYGINDDKVIFIDGKTDKKLTFGQLKSNSKKLAAGLINKVGFKPGDVLAIFSLNHIDYPVVIFGTIAAGGKVTTVIPKNSVEEVSNQLKDCGASVIIVHPRFLMAAIKAADKAKIDKSKIFLFDDKGIYKFQPLSSLISDQEINPVEYTPEEAKLTTAYIYYTSGTTTGMNKGVELTHTNMVSSTAQLHAFETQITHENVFMGELPFFHIYGLSFLVHLVVLKGASCVILDNSELETFCRIIQDYKVNIVPTVPPTISRLVEDPHMAKKYILSSLQLVISAAAPLGKGLSNKFTEIYKTPIKQGYGLTETSPTTHLTRTDNIVNGSIGGLIPNVECKIISENGQELGYNEPGEFCVRGPNIMKGYLNNEEATNACIDRDGWFHTGDIGFVDPQGNFFIIDRVKELIRYNELRITKSELEHVLLTHSSIADAAVNGNERAVAYVVLKQNEIQSKLLKEEIKNFVSQRIAHGILRDVYFIDQIPRNYNGKTLRRLLRSRL